MSYRVLLSFMFLYCLCCIFFPNSSFSSTALRQNEILQQSYIEPVDFPSANYIAANSQSNSITSINGRPRVNSGVPSNYFSRKFDDGVLDKNISLAHKDTKPVITVGYVNGYGLMSDHNSYNSKGYGYDLLVKFGRYADIEFKFVESKEDVIKAVQDGEVDIAGLYSITPERQRQVAFGKIPVGATQYSLVARGEQAYFYDDHVAINGKTVATYNGNPGNRLLDTYLKQHNISVEYVVGGAQDFMNLDTDFYLTNSTVHTEEDFYSVLNLGLRNLYFFARKDNEQLLNYLDQKLYAFFTENASFPDFLEHKYGRVGNEFLNRSLTRKEAAMLKGKTFKVGYADDYQPYSFKDSLGNPGGVNIEFMNVLAKKYGFNVEYVPFNLNHSWSNFEGLDILASLIGERNHVRRFYESTDPYDNTSLNLVFRDDFDFEQNSLSIQKEGKQPIKIGMLNYISFPYSAFFKRFPNIKVTHYPNPDEILKDFFKKELDAFVATELGARTIASSLITGKMHMTIHLSLPMGFQISKRLSDEYVELFNVIINRESKKTVEEISVRELAKYSGVFGSEQFFKQNKWYFMAFGLVITLVCVGLIYIIRQRSTIGVLAKDTVTPLISLSQFSKEVDDKLKNSKVGEYKMIILDIDYFRMINNYYGTTKGTEVIQAMADALLDAYRGNDVLITRRIAEQFIVFKKIDEAKEIQEVINSYVVPRVKAVVGESYSLKMSIAMCKNYEQGETTRALLDNLNIAHQKAKKVHRTSYVEFTEEMRREATTMLDIIYRMEHAIENGEFVVHYQPKIDMRGLEIIGAEALIRWLPPIGNPIYPNEFIPVMEENGFISQLELYVFEDICKFLQNNSKGFKIPKVAINISPITLANANLIKKMVMLLKEYAVSPKQIEVEITESAIGDFEESLPTIIKILHKVGFSVAMDDFGAGNSSLNRLSMIEVDVLKLDKVFLDFHEDAPRGSLVVQQIIELAKQLGMKVVAEGIETYEQAKWLQNIKCDIAQGYYFERVLNEDAFIDLLSSNKKYNL